MKAMLEEKKVSLEKSLEQLVQKHTELSEQIVMHRGALQYNSMLLKEMEEAEAKAAKPAAVPAAE